VYGATLTGRDGRALRVPAAVTIAADGRRSTLGIALGLVRQPRAPRRWAIGAYFDDVAGLARMGEMHVRRGHYIGVAPLGGQLVNVCLVTIRAAIDDPAALLERRLAADPLLADRFAGARRVSAATVMGPLAVDASAAGLPGLLLAGDAAGFIDPMTGDGLRIALRGAELAVACAEEGLASGTTTPHLALRARRCHELGGKLRVNRLLRILSGSPSAVGAAGLVARVTPGLLRAVIRYEGDLDTM
jgi:flavin-dependent dehydrogenase